MPRHPEVAPDRALVRRGARHVRAGVLILVACTAVAIIEGARGVAIPAVLYLAALYHGSRIAGIAAVGVAIVLGALGLFAGLVGATFLLLRAASVEAFDGTPLLVSASLLVVATGFALTWMTTPAAAWHEARRLRRRQRAEVSLADWRAAREGGR